MLSLRGLLHTLWIHMFKLVNIIAIMQKELRQGLFAICRSLKNWLAELKAEDKLSCLGP